MSQTTHQKSQQTTLPNHLGDHFDAVDNPLTNHLANITYETAPSTGVQQLIANRIYSKQSEYQRYELQRKGHALQTTYDYIFAGHGDATDPAPVFDKLRWGGQFIFASEHASEVESLATRYERNGFKMETQPDVLRKPICGLPIPGLGQKVHFFNARKVQLVRPGEFTDRFTYHVHLTESNNECVVTKQIPELSSTIHRLQQRFPEEDPKTIEKHAKKLIDKIFPVFLTREAAFLKLLRKHMPAAYQNRIPHELATEKDENGMVRSLNLNWLRKTTEPITQLDFAEQAAELLHHLHEKAKIIHLDLRLDNIVITDNGVGFIDFGSSARVNEDIAGSPFLDSLFREMMKTSQIQRMLTKMTDSGMVTSEVLTSSHHKVDKGVDLFYLAVQIAEPHSNPDIRELVIVDESSDEFRLIEELKNQVLKPDNPIKPKYSSAADIIEGLALIRKQLGR